MAAFIAACSFIWSTCSLVLYKSPFLVLPLFHCMPSNTVARKSNWLSSSFKVPQVPHVCINCCSVLVPDLFRGDQWDKERPEAELEEWIHKQSTDRLEKNMNTCIKWMIDEFTAAGQPSEKLGIIGFCFGGRWLLKTLANDRQGNFAAGVCFYGTRLNPSLAADVKAPVLFIAGDKDPLCPTSVLMDIRRSLPGSRTVIYPGRGHGFAHRPESPEEDEDAEKAFVLMRNWLHDELLRKAN